MGRVFIVLSHWIDSANDWTGKGVSLLLLAMVAIVTGEVIARYIFNKPSIWEWDVLLYGYCMIVALGAGYTLLHKSHVIVDVLSGRFSPRVRAILDMVTSLFFFFGVGLFLWLAVQEAEHSVAISEHGITILAPPIYPLRILWVIGLILFVLQGISKFINDLNIARTGRDTTLPERKDVE